ncbi:MAG: MBL fold metallo-hydrolase [Crocinitomicaceae bacterium]|nr:MBL fold metallo-hydrolase [Crocinitomicaceae bacterium]
MSKTSFTVTILGSGTSQGVPVIACNCTVCLSESPKDKRLRSSIMLTINGLNYVIDTGPDFRQQMLREKVQHLEAIFFTHQHKDHLAGLDDVRAFNFKQKKDMKIYCDTRVEEALHREYEYVFSSFKYPGIPLLDIEIIDKNSIIAIQGSDAPISTIEAMHYKLPVLGFRYKDFTYITDAKSFADVEIEKVKGSKVLIINALRREEHLSHFNLQEALDFIALIQPENAYLTHISHLLGLHDEVEKELPPNVHLAYDGLQIEI